MAVNILYLIDSLNIGGTERQMVQLIRNLDRSHFQTYLGTLKEGGCLLDELDIPKVALPFRSFSHPSILTSTMRLSKFIRRHDIRIVQTYFQDPFLAAALLRPFHRIKLIGSFRDLGFWRTSFETHKMRLAYPFFSGFIANSIAVKTHFVQTDGISPGKIEVIYNGIDAGKLKQKPAIRSLNTPPTVGIVANCNRPVKRVRDFILAAALVRRKLPDVRFVVVGDGQLRTQLEELSTSLGLDGALMFAGSVENPIEMVRSFQVGVITSESEGFCNAILEYMSCGVPVVATAVGGNPELVIDGENGFLVPVGDIEMMAVKIVSLLIDRRLFCELGNAGLKAIQSEFSVQKMVKSHQEFYSRIMN